MKRYLLDTSVIIDFLRRRHGVVEFISSLEAELTTSFVCVAELYEGVYKVANKKAAEEAVLTFCDRVTEIYGLDLEIAKKFGQNKADLQSMGNVIDDLDIFIASTCQEYNLTLITLNPKHFSRIPNLKVVTV